MTVSGLRLLCAFLLVAWLTLAGAFLDAQTEVHAHWAAQRPECARLQTAAHALEVGTAHASPLSARRQMLRFLDTHPDDPADCVTSALYSRLLAVEKTLIRVQTAAGRSSPPEWLMLCNTISPRTQRCQGPVADAIPILDDEKLQPTSVVAAPTGAGRIVLQPGLACTVITVSAAESANLQNGQPPTVLGHGSQQFSTDPLKKMQSPILIATLRCSGNLRLRKAAWVVSR